MFQPETQPDYRDFQYNNPNGNRKSGFTKYLKKVNNVFIAGRMDFSIEDVKVQTLVEKQQKT